MNYLDNFVKLQNFWCCRNTAENFIAQFTGEFFCTAAGPFFLSPLIGFINTKTSASQGGIKPFTIAGLLQGGGVHFGQNFYSKGFIFFGTDFSQMDLFWSIIFSSGFVFKEGFFFKRICFPTGFCQADPLF